MGGRFIVGFGFDWIGAQELFLGRSEFLSPNPRDNHVLVPGNARIIQVVLQSRHVLVRLCSFVSDNSPQHANMSQKDSKFFSSGTKKGEIHELKEDLDSSDTDRKKNALKKIIADMTVGKDVSMLFSDVVKCMNTANIETKKLVIFIFRPNNVNC